MNIEYDTCVPCGKAKHNVCGYTWEQRNKWIPCASDVNRISGILSTSPGWIPTNPNSDYTTSEALSDALKYCRYVAEDPENAPELKDDNYGRPDLIERDRRNARKRAFKKE